MSQENVPALLKELEGGNRYHERVTLVSATKTRHPAESDAATAPDITNTRATHNTDHTAEL